MPELAWAFISDVVSEMCGIPDHDILPIDGLAVDPRIETGFIGRPHGDRAIIYLCSPVAQYPEITAREWPIRHCRRHPIRGARDDFVGFTRRFI